MPLTLSTSAFVDGETIPAKFTCEGANVSPAFSWSGVPGGAKSLALACIDPDAPGGVFHHWAIYDLPADLDGLEEGVDAAGLGAREAVTDFRKPGYGGPCPPPGHGTHHYHFRLYALDVERLDLHDAADCRAVVDAAGDAALETAEIVGLYERR